MKLAVITAYPSSKVTLSEYGYHLVKHFRNNPEISELILLTDQSDAPKDIETDHPGCRVKVVPCWAFNDWSNLWRIQKALSQHRPDAVLYNLQFLKFGDQRIPAALGLFSPMVTRWRGFPTVTLLHNIMETVDLENAGFTANPIKQWAYRQIGNRLTRIVLQSDVLALTISKYVGILEKKFGARNITLVPHGSFEIPEEPDYRLPEGPRQIMAFGKFGTYKKVESLIEAVEILRARTDFDLEIVIAGTDSPNTPGYLEGVAQKYAHVPGLRFTGYVAEADVPALFAEAAVVAFPYTSTTGSSGVLHQAGSYGKAVVLPDIGDLGILVREEGYKGEFFEPENHKSLAEALDHILSFPAYRMHLGKANYRAACSLPMSVITQRYIDLFKALIRGRQEGFAWQTLLKEPVYETEDI
ncbi:glycosyltransferase [Robiginitalea sp. M366]|uniref:glycosyltransferase n=1 Tax=Robiginitalea aestuariiviva TaxID=3036903 RepID=UPI00240D7235|nr:glycosyltransferase [Robiginitalea aestuariiviva]MDG1573366.1 glycosyltransferase [Robiginitalea aestuariiviva]